MKKILGFVLAVAMCGILPVGFANATVWTDQADYSPGSVVTISGDNSDGAGFIAGETVDISVTSPYGSESGSTTVGEDGSFSWQFTLPNDGSAVGNYSYTATGLTSGVVQSEVFTDGPVVNFTGNAGPANFAATAISSTQISLKWDNVAQADDFHIDRSTDNINWTFVISLGSPYKYDDTGLTSGTSYYYRIRAHHHTATVSFTNYSTAGATTFVSVFVKSDQTITVTTSAPSSAIYNSTFQVAATASSGLPVAITTNCAGGGTGSATITMTSGIYACAIQYNQAGNGTYNSAPQITSLTTAQKKDASVTPNADSKTYGASEPTLSGTLVGFVAADGVTASYSRTSGETVAGSPYTISATLSPTGLSDNYNITSNTANFTITRKALTPSIVADNKNYDGTNAATIASRSLATIIDGDEVSLVGGTATFASSNVGTWLVTETGLSLAGAQAGNYSLISTQASDSADIAALVLTPTIVAADKTYDGTNSATITSCSVSGTVPGDTVTCSTASAAFADKNVGKGKVVTATGITLGGAAASKYLLSATTGTATADIAALEITGSFTADDKTYDGNSSADVGDRSLNGDLAGDDVQLDGGTATFANKNVGDGKTVTLTGATLAGNDAGNYDLTSVGTATADITALEITGSFTADNKTYDGNSSADVGDRSLNGDLAGDDVQLDGGTATFANKNVGDGKTVTLTGATLAGNDAGNYDLTSVGTATADITALEITGSFTADDKTYDGNSSADVHTSLDDVLSGDQVSLGGTATFADKNVGTGKEVTLTGAALAGDDAGNYSLTSTQTTDLADITALGITPGIVANDKTYDGTTAATIASRSLATIISGDQVSLVGGTATFANKNVGTWNVTETGLTLAGNDAGNYSLTSTSATDSADIRAYSFVGFSAPLSISLKEFKLTSTIPVKFGLFNIAGRSVGNAIATLTVNGKLAVSSGGSNVGNFFRYSSTGEQYIFNLSTKMLSVGTFKLVATLDDGTIHSQFVTIK
jgi:hypothetical protein